MTDLLGRTSLRDAKSRKAYGERIFCVVLIVFFVGRIFDAIFTGLALQHDAVFWYGHEQNPWTVSLTRTYGFPLTLLVYWLPANVFVLFVGFLLVRWEWLQHLMGSELYWKLLYATDLVMIPMTILSYLGWIGWVAHI